MKPAAAKSTLTPKLRFPKFRGAERWKQMPLGHLLLGGPDYGVNAAAVPYSDKLPKYLRITDISDDGRYLREKQVSVDLEPAPENFLDEGDIVLARTGASVGKSYRYRKEDGQLVFAGFLIRVKPDPKRLDSAYLANFLTTDQYWKWVAVTSSRSGQPGINSVEYGSLEIPLPTDFTEQQKIAECLSSVDEVIASQARKVDALKTHKKGLMQQLFPREGETQPRLRFPEFQNAGDWEERKLGTVCEIQRGRFSHRPRNDPRFFGGQYPFIQTGDVVKSGGGPIVASQSLNEEGLAVSKLFKPTIVLITIAANIGDTGLLRTKACFTDSVAGLIPTPSVIPFFLELIMRGQKEYLNKVATTGAQKNINNEILREVSVLLPPVAEQQRIADCLNSLDALITAETQKLETLKLHKKGLMQQLFPSPEEAEA